MNKEKFLVITERNQWEGETWSFFFKDSKLNRKFFDLSKKHLESDPCYSFSVEHLSLEVIEDRKKCRTMTYMGRYNFMAGNYDFEKGINKIKTEDIDRLKDPFYKGQYEDFKIGVQTKGGI